MGSPLVIDRLRHHARRPLARTPYLWDVAMLLRPGKRRTLARRDSTIVIDGFLRSGNTFSVAAFQVANGSAAHMGRHLHGGPHVLRAVRLGLPTVVLIRQPEDAVASYLVRRPTLTPCDALIEYLDFYRTAWRARDGFVVAPFDQVIDDFGSVIDAVNTRFGTSFARYVPTADNDEAAFRLVEEMNRLECHGQVVETHVGRPSRERSTRKADVLARMREPSAEKRLKEAQELHDRYLSVASAQGGDERAR